MSSRHRFFEDRLQRHAGDFCGVLRGEEQAKSGSLPGGQIEQLDAVERDTAT